jgi:hypothetical protein
LYQEIFRARKLELRRVDEGRLTTIREMRFSNPELADLQAGIDIAVPKRIK